MKIKRIIISGGGTGGHIFPALSIAGEIAMRNPDAEILFVGASGRMEMEKVPAAGYKIVGLPVVGFPRKPGLKYFSFAYNLLKSAFLAQKIIRKFKPEVAVGVGGYASGPLLRTATRMKIPSLIQEQNSYAGMTNKILGKKVKTICVAYDKMEKYFPSEKIVLTGNPVRKDLIYNTTDKQEASVYYKLLSDKKVVLILGGSLGAKSINHTVLKNIRQISTSDYQFIWQTGALYYQNIINEIEKTKPENLHVYQFLNRMDLAYSAADLIVSRAGAGTISELCIVSKPVILIPSPNVAEDHQTKNALQVSEKGAAVFIRDSEIAEQLFSEIDVILKDQNRMKSLAKNIGKLAKPMATEEIVNQIENLIN